MPAQYAVHYTVNKATVRYVYQHTVLTGRIKEYVKHNDAQIFLFFLNLIAVAIVVQIQDTKERAGIFLTKGNTTRHVFSFENAYVLCVFALCAHLNNQSGGVFIVLWERRIMEVYFNVWTGKNEWFRNC